MTTRITSAGLLLAALVLAGCGESVTPLDLAGPPAELSMTSGDGQAGATGATLTNPIVVRVTDAQGQPVPAVKITWTAQRGTLQRLNDSTDNDGYARMSWVLPATSGRDTVTAAIGGSAQVRFVADVQPVAGTITYRYLDAGSYHACGVTTTEELICWGYGADGQLGLGSTSPKQFPTHITGDQRYRLVSGGRFHACAVTLSQLAYCWGSNADGRLGSGGAGGMSTTPAAVVHNSLQLSFQANQAGQLHSCGIDLTRHLWCWGYDGEGEIGVDASPTPGTFKPVSLVGDGFRAVTTGGMHTCAIAEDGSASCWGFNAEGQLGNNGSATSGLPVAVAGALAFQTDPVLVPPSPDPNFPLPPGPFIAAGYEHTCALTTAGAAMCWGLNQDGQLGDGTRTLRRAPAAVSGGLTFARITAGRQHTCAITSAGAAYCWGDNTFGQLGDGTTTERTAPRQVSGGLTFAYVKAGDLSTCGVTTTGVAYCWGDNEYGQLGDGTTVAANVPTKVAFQP